eukprot:3657857-Prymnesium_polylepis.1
MWRVGQPPAESQRTGAQEALSHAIAVLSLKLTARQSFSCAFDGRPGLSQFATNFRSSIFCSADSNQKRSFPDFAHITVDSRCRLGRDRRARIGLGPR